MSFLEKPSTLHSVVFYKKSDLVVSILVVEKIVESRHSCLVPAPRASCNFNLDIIQTMALMGVFAPVCDIKHVIVCVRGDDQMLFHDMG